MPDELDSSSPALVQPTSLMEEKGNVEGWQPIETCPGDDVELWFWIRPKTAEESWVDTSGCPILAIDAKPRLHMGKRGCWPSLMTATHWMYPRWPLPPSPSEGDKP